VTENLGADEEAPDPDALPAPGRAGLTRNIYVVSLVSLCQDAASEMLYPILPIFLTATLGAAPAVVAIIEGLADGTAAVTKVFAGRRADLNRRRPIIAAGYGISSLGKVLVALAAVWPVVMVARVTDRVGKGVRGAPRDALIADETTPGNRGRAFGFHRMADTTGAVIGPLLALAGYRLLGEQLRPLLYLAIIPAVVSTLLVFLIRERSHTKPTGTRRRLTPSALPAAMWRLLGFLAVFSMVNFPDALLLLRADELGLGITGVILVYVLYNLTYAALSYPAGAVSDRIDRRHVFGVGLVIFAVTYLGFGLTTTPGAVWILLPVYGAYTALTDGVSRAWVADLAPVELRGTALGTQGLLTGAGLVFAGIWAGTTWADSGHLPFVISGIAAAVLAAVLLSPIGARVAPAID